MCRKPKQQPRCIALISEAKWPRWLKAIPNVPDDRTKAKPRLALARNIRSHRIYIPNDADFSEQLVDRGNDIPGQPSVMGMRAQGGRDGCDEDDSAQPVRVCPLDKDQACGVPLE